jgi:hypothetical protein
MRCAARSCVSRTVKDFRHTRKGVPHLRVSGKGGKTRYLPLHPGTNGLINDYLDAAPRQYRHNARLRSPPHTARGQPDVQGRLLTTPRALHEVREPRGRRHPLS